MKSSSSSFSANLGTNGLTANLLRRGVLRQLAGLRNGQLVIVERGERHVFGKNGALIQAEIHLLDSAAWGMVASNG
ncbi:SAM-dependent methyltransferase, partial [Pseudomonas syringae]|nr:SAM-dependent methyltransferase [Pseudomonas syringae]